MTSLWQAFSKVGTAAGAFAQSWLRHTSQIAGPTIVSSAAGSKTLSVCAPLMQTRWLSSQIEPPPSPYKRPGPRRYGYSPKMWMGGVLPRQENARPLPIPAYRPKDRWTRKRALFGQNDYIDILGDGNVHPVDLITGPPWLIGFKGNELQRLVRYMRIQGRQMRILDPSKYHQISKRIKFLYKRYNHSRQSKSY